MGIACPMIECPPKGGNSISGWTWQSRMDVFTRQRVPCHLKHTIWPSLISKSNARYSFSKMLGIGMRECSSIYSHCLPILTCEVFGNRDSDSARLRLPVGNCACA